MSADVFIDTNVFIYHLDSTDARKHRLADQIVRRALSGADACVSWQVVQECLLSEDLQHGQQLDGLRVVDPFG